MSSVVSQGMCKKCGSSDANTEYADGHFFCYSCRNYIPAKIKSIEQASSILLPKSQEKYLHIPHDLSKEIPLEPLTWLKSYGLTDKEIGENYVWSSKEEMLINIFYDWETKKLVGWQGRYFPKRKPKSHTVGRMDSNCFVWGSHIQFDGVCVVEDVVSAIKVGRVVPSVALLGSNLSLPRAVKLSHKYNTLYIWLDSDKVAHAHTLRKRYMSLFNNVIVIYTKLDPKENSDVEISKAFMV